MLPVDTWAPRQARGKLKLSYVINTGYYVGSVVICYYSVVIIFFYWVIIHFLMEEEVVFVLRIHNLQGRISNAILDDF